MIHKRMNNTVGRDLLVRLVFQHNQYINCITSKGVILLITFPDDLSWNSHIFEWKDILELFLWQSIYKLRQLFVFTNFFLNIFSNCVYRLWVFSLNSLQSPSITLLSWYCDRDLWHVMNGFIFTVSKLTISWE